ncbi:hypothetical protein OAN13_01865 [Opitutales bacterium]|nr:hypothetical protein [Opitutales bacterium]
MKILSLLIFPFLLCGCLSNISKNNPLEYDDRLVENVQVTSDIKLLGKVEGEGNQVELFGFLRFGDNGRANYDDEHVDVYQGNEMIHASKQSAVFNALKGSTDSFLLDPQFRTTTNNFFIFKTTKSEVVGQKAAKDNYRQIKRFSTDRSDTVPLPHSYTINRNGVEATKITTSYNFPPHIADTISVIETPSDVQAVTVNKTTNRADNLGNMSNSLETLESRLLQNRKKLNLLSRSFQSGN